MAKYRAEFKLSKLGVDCGGLQSWEWVRNISESFEAADDKAAKQQLPEIIALTRNKNRHSYSCVFKRLVCVVVEEELRVIQSDVTS